jgi:hypothetical protein
MLTQEEAKVLRFLRGRFLVNLSDVGRVCLPGASRECIDRLLANLEWHGYVVVLRDTRAGQCTVQATERGRESTANGSKILAGG